MRQSAAKINCIAINKVQRLIAPGIIYLNK